MDQRPAREHPRALSSRDSFRVRGVPELIKSVCPSPEGIGISSQDSLTGFECQGLFVFTKNPFARASPTVGTSRHSVVVGAVLDHVDRCRRACDGRRCQHGGRGERCGRASGAPINADPPPVPADTVPPATAHRRGSPSSWIMVCTSSENGAVLARFS